jgi:hypothetical protein
VIVDRYPFKFFNVGLELEVIFFRRAGFIENKYYTIIVALEDRVPNDTTLIFGHYRSVSVEITMANDAKIFILAVFPIVKMSPKTSA